MTAAEFTGTGTAEDPWVLQTPSLRGDFRMHRDEAADPPALVCVVGKTELRYHLRAVEDLHAMLVDHGDWVPLGSADEQKPAAEGTVEAWGRAADNPVGGWYGLKKGLRGRFGNYLPPLLEALGLAEVEHDARGQPDPRRDLAATSPPTRGVRGSCAGLLRTGLRELHRLPDGLPVRRDRGCGAPQLRHRQPTAVGSHRRRLLT